MEIERTDKELIIKIPISVGTEELQDFVNFTRYKELTSGYKTDQKIVDKLSDEINNQFWNKNRTHLP